MRKYNFVRSSAGDMGIGAMIVFIAMVLVAGIAASVLVQTANKLEIQAMTTGQQTTTEVATGLSVDSICAGKGTYNYGPIVGIVTGKLCNMTIAISPRSGSTDIDISKLTVELSDSSQKVILNYTTSLYKDLNVAGVFATKTAFNGSARSFGLIKIVDADGSLGVAGASNPVLNKGDHALLTITPGKSFSGWVARTHIWGMVIPEQGAPGTFSFTTPALSTSTVYSLE